MLDLKVEITEYDKESNTCIATLSDGVEVTLDPFVACTLLSDVEYEDGKGYELVGHVYMITEYSVHGSKNKYVTPHEGGMIKLY